MEGQGYSHGNGKISGTTKSNAKYADLNMQEGNSGKAIGDKGVKNPQGNSRTMCAADRYRSTKAT